MDWLLNTIEDAPPEQAQRILVAIRALNAAGEMTMHTFEDAMNGTLDIDDKEDGSPVTRADREAEALIKAVITANFPDDAKLGEEQGHESGNQASANDWRWVIDPIDGTVSFTHGVPVFGMLIGIEYQGNPVAGVMHFPGLSETVWATDAGAFWKRGDRDSVPARVSTTHALADAMVCMTSLDYLPDNPDAWLRVHNAAKRTRGWSDCHGALLLVTGRVDAVIEPELNPWDISAIIAVLRHAGGTFTDWHANHAFDSNVRRGLSSNGHLHDELIATLSA